MKILILSPTCPPEITGNAMTAKRLNSGLAAKGVELSLLRSGSDDLSSHVSTFQPDIIHALHASKSGSVAMKLSERHNIPYVVTITGTDLYIDLCQSGSNEVSLILERAASIIVCSELTRKRLISVLPVLSEKIKVIKKSIPFDLPAETFPDKSSGATFLLPSGIRPVKDPTFAIKPLELLRKKHRTITLIVAGPRLDEAEWELFQAKSEGREWIRHLTVSHEEMPRLYCESDIVLNTSISEGLSNAVLEAMYFGRAVLASDCEGNRAIIEDGMNGMLYKTGSEEDFLRKAERLLSDPPLRQKLGQAASSKVKREYCLEDEIEAHISLYCEIVG